MRITYSSHSKEKSFSVDKGEVIIGLHKQGMVFDLTSRLTKRSPARTPHHPQTNGKLERFHQTLKERVNLLVYISPESLRAAMANFIEFYNYRLYHEGIGNITPAYMYYRRREELRRFKNYAYTWVA